jgi:hypothetical protein
MQIDIDFPVYKALTALRESESDSYNDVLRRLLEIPTAPQTPEAELEWQDFDLKPYMIDRNLPGVWYGNVHFPPGTKFRATYKGQTHLAEVRNNQWVGEDGKVRRSPSDAAGAISGTNVNGWRFWNAQRPGDTEWRRLDELKP